MCASSGKRVSSKRPFGPDLPLPSAKQGTSKPYQTCRFIQKPSCLVAASPMVSTLRVCLCMLTRSGYARLCTLDCGSHTHLCMVQMGWCNIYKETAL